VRIKNSFDSDIVQFTVFKCLCGIQAYGTSAEKIEDEWLGNIALRRQH